MARRTTHSSNSRNRVGHKSSASPLIIVTLCVVALSALAATVWFLTRNDGYIFQRAHLDKYVEMTRESHLLDNGASVYLDMSDGMNCAYRSSDSRNILRSIIDKLAANNAIEFFRLSEEKITALDDYSHTQLYNYMLNPNSYNMQRAPIEKTLKQIVEKQQPALVMSDLEEYKGGVIERAAYAKRYFIDWLAQGFNIILYKWNFSEGNKEKKMFIAVFDDNANRLYSLVDNAISLIEAPVDKYILGSRDFAYPICTNYPSLKQGGNYHNEKGFDAVTAVMDRGGNEDYICYAKPYATATGVVGQFAPLDTSLGTLAEYYPLGVSWGDAIVNSKQLSEPGVPDDIKYTHLLRNLFVDLNAQSGFTINDIEIRVFDMQRTMEQIALQGDSIIPADIKGINNPEVNMVLTAGMYPSELVPDGWKEICVDFDEKFDGTFIGNTASTNLLRANIVISKAIPEVQQAIEFFGWENNLSLANSVKETLTASTSNPQGRILYTYYLKTITE